MELRFKCQFTRKILIIGPKIVKPYTHAAGKELLSKLKIDLGVD